MTVTKPKWWEGTITGFDTETTGTDPREARIVTAAVVHRIPAQRPNGIEWVIDPGIDIPAEAAAVHGWTNDRIRDFVGMPDCAMRVSGDQRVRMTREAALEEIAAALATATYVETPVVIANAPYDATLLDAELVRHGLDPVAGRNGGWRGIIDPQVVEKQYDPWRKQCYKRGPNPDAGGTVTDCDRENRIHYCGGCRGSKGYQCGGCGITDRTLEALCRHYGVVITSAHSASADALAAMRLSVKLASLWPEVARWLLPTLHKNQVDWRREQQKGLRDFFLRVGKTEEAAGMCPEWPVHARCAPAETAVAS